MAHRALIWFQEVSCNDSDHNRLLLMVVVEAMYAKITNTAMQCLSHKRLTSIKYCNSRSPSYKIQSMKLPS